MDLNNAVFVIKKNPVGRYYFVFQASDCNVLTVSKSFSSRSELEICIVAIREYAQIADVIEGNHQKQAEIFPQFLITETQKSYSFSLKGFNNEVVFSSELYKDIKQCQEAIDYLKSTSFDAGVMDSFWNKFYISYKEFESKFSSF